MRPIRLCFALTSPVRGGIEEVVLGLLRRLDPGEFRLALAAPPELIEAFREPLAGVTVDTIGVRADSWLKRAEITRLGRFIKRWRPDIVNPHLFRSTAVAAPLARWLGVRAIVETYHGREAWRRGPLRGRFVVDRVIARLLDRVIAVSEAARGFLVTAKGYPADKVVVVPNGCDLSVFSPGLHRTLARKELDVDDAVPLVGVVARLEPQKGHTHLLDAWPSVLRELPDARLLVVGEGGLAGALQQRASSLGIAGHVRFLGFRGDVPRLLDAIDVLALPSLYEGMPLTVIEAAAMAKPVVATAVDGTVEVVREGVTGHLVPPEDAGTLAAALVRVLSDRDRAAEMGRAGRAHVLGRFSVDRHVEATARVYRSLVT
jgi:glycosyltransferase involved in cell wall biosynthesis